MGNNKKRRYFEYGIIMWYWEINRLYSCNGGKLNKEKKGNIEINGNMIISEYSDNTNTVKNNMKCSIICSISKCGKWCLPNRRNNCNDDIMVVSMVRLVAVSVKRWDVFWVQQSKIDLTYYIIKEGIGMPDCCLDRIFVGWGMVKRRRNMHVLCCPMIQV